MHRQTVESDPNGEEDKSTILAATGATAEAMHSHENSRNLKQAIQRWTTSERLCYSIELIPREDFQLDLGRLAPVFCSLPWISDNNLQYQRFVDTPMLKMTAKIVPHCSVMNHLSCYNITETQVDKFVDMGNWNLFVIRGDTVSEGQRFQHSCDLVEYLRSKNNPDLTIGVGGYPYGHPEAPSVDHDVKYLKQKVDLGVDFIVTQTLYVRRLLPSVRGRVPPGGHQRTDRARAVPADQFRTAGNGAHPNAGQSPGRGAPTAAIPRP